jgi:prepilin-type N-terminal cleavage/methylation domain-containing protein
MNRLASADHCDGRSGFTLVEFSIVLVLITILTALAVSTYGMIANKARMTQALTVLNLLSKTETAYFSDHNLYTDNLALLDFGPVEYNYYQVSVVLDNDAKNYKGIAMGIGVMAGDCWTITKDGKPVQADNSAFR